MTLIVLLSILLHGTTVTPVMRRLDRRSKGEQLDLPLAGEAPGTERA